MVVGGGMTLRLTLSILLEDVSRLRFPMAFLTDLGSIVDSLLFLYGRPVFWSTMRDFETDASLLDIDWSR